MTDTRNPWRTFSRGILAVNAHDDLLLALRTARDRLAMMLRPDDPRNDDAFRLVDDTIKRVEGE